jgi:hypothetical protein
MVQALTRLMATFGILQGVGIIYGGPGRWASPSLQVAMMVPYAPASWGVAIAAMGVLAIAGTFLSRHRLTAAAMFGMSAWCLFFALGLLITVLREPKVATTGVPTYFALAVVCCCLSVAYAQSRTHQAYLRRVV